jgi:hypothetical protein
MGTQNHSIGSKHIQTGRKTEKNRDCMPIRESRIANQSNDPSLSSITSRDIRDSRISTSASPADIWQPGRLPYNCEVEPAPRSRMGIGCGCGCGFRANGGISRAAVLHCQARHKPVSCVSLGLTNPLMAGKNERKRAGATDRVALRQVRCKLSRLDIRHEEAGFGGTLVVAGLLAMWKIIADKSFLLAVESTKPQAYVQRSVF